MRSFLWNYWGLTQILRLSLLPLPLREVCPTFRCVEWLQHPCVCVLILNRLFSVFISSWILHHPPFSCASAHLSRSPPLLRPSVPVFFSSLESLLMHEGMSWQVSSHKQKVGFILNSLWKSWPPSSFFLTSWDTDRRGKSTRIQYSRGSTDT